MGEFSRVPEQLPVVTAQPLRLLSVLVDVVSG